MHRLARFRPSPALVTAIAAVVVASAGSATAARLITGKEIKNGSIGAADLRKALRGRLPAGFVKVGPDGSVFGSRNVGQVARIAPGDFTVPYKRNIERCAAVATIRGTADNQFFGYITTYTINATTVRVLIRNPFGFPTDGAGFSLAVIC